MQYGLDHTLPINFVTMGIEYIAAIRLSSPGERIHMRNPARLGAIINIINIISVK